MQQTLRNLLWFRCEQIPRTENSVRAFRLDPKRDPNLPIFWVMFSSSFEPVDFFIWQWEQSRRLGTLSGNSSVLGNISCLRDSGNLVRAVRRPMFTCHMSDGHLLLLVLFNYGTSSPHVLGESEHTCLFRVSWEIVKIFLKDRPVQSLAHSKDLCWN